MTFALYFLFLSGKPSDVIVAVAVIDKYNVPLIYV